MIKKGLDLFYGDFKQIFFVSGFSLLLLPVIKTILFH